MEVFGVFNCTCSVLSENSVIYLRILARLLLHGRKRGGRLHLQFVNSVSFHVTLFHDLPVDHKTVKHDLPEPLNSGHEYIGSLRKLTQREG